MNDIDIEQIAAWVVHRGLTGASETDLMDGFCARCSAAGLELSRGLAIIDTLHPTYEGRAFRWRNDDVEESALIEFGPTNEGEAAENWQKSAFYHILTTGADEMRCPLGPTDPVNFSQLQMLREQGQTEYFALIQRFADKGTIGEMDCFYSSWTTAHPDGFRESTLAALRRLTPSLALAIKCASLTRIAGTLVEVYLGQDAGQRVLSGRISRGVAERISAVLWFSDLRGYTAITDTAPPDEVIPLLNDYADAVITSIREAGGEVLKLIGDGTLAIFKSDDRAEACRAALRAEAALRERQRALNAQRMDQNRPVTSVYLGLHIGDVFYGNIGSHDRLDFTVIGPAVNEVNRIASMCRSVDRPVVLSSEFVTATPDPERRNLVSVGRYALRGVGRAQELFTIDPALL
ncbi:adenylate/guanylate cyclase domain-containing protein [Reyranella sp. CPCC 100927]|uniref:adenylate/guanylate cyclase domain-containing protein n=1 Tax=Reyranella sp. CPCC 100927 TaxID=2599616 RepID=UPI0011B4A8F6|nr:adenylate/guanylate cyclase domain-containing protein [Reyranella sp. CPCC 100927]TWT05825.1 adenylate/guanylate cyclase domain-containing protein [Reyranella sp. CPCC 100927]